MSVTRAEAASAGAEPGPVATKAAVRAADRLGISARALAAILGVSEATVSRMRSGVHALQPGQKPFELAILFTRMFRSLDAITGGDEAAAAAWMRGPNGGLGGIPLELIRSIPGLVHVVQYLDARRALL
jgi:hypothetical protein